jgi:hypothetical protein
MTTASYPFEGYDLALSLDGEPGFAWVRFEDRAVAERVARSLAAGDSPRIQMDLPADTDTGGHAISDVLTADLRLLDDDDVIGHAISVRLPNAQAAHVRMLATGALDAGRRGRRSRTCRRSIGAPTTGAGGRRAAQQRAGEFAAGGARDPAAGADFRAGEIGQFTGLTDYRTGGQCRSRSRHRDRSGGRRGQLPPADQRQFDRPDRLHRRDRAGAGAPRDRSAASVADFRAGEIGAG